MIFYPEISTYEYSSNFDGHYLKKFFQLWKIEEQSEKINLNEALYIVCSFLRRNLLTHNSSSQGSNGIVENVEIE